MRTLASWVLGSLAILVAADDAAAAPRPRPSGQKNPAARPFRMGFTGFVPDITPEAVARSRKFVRENGDLIAHHIEGVPWAESLRGAPYPPNFLEEWTNKKGSTPPKGKVYLAISPGREDLKPAEKCGPLPPELRRKPYDDPLVKKAFLAYCRRAIAFFQPDYLCIGIEVNEIHDAGPEKWRAYLDLHRHIYEAVKKERPRLPVFASFTLHNLFKKRGASLDELKALMPWCDLVAVSYYPFFVDEKDRLVALDWLVEEFESLRKPFAMVETNDAAERLRLSTPGLVIEGTPAKQLAYYEKLLGLAQERRFEFVVSFVHQDYDRLWEKIRSKAPELFGLWRDCGFIDEFGEVRPALALWKAHLARPLEPRR